MDERLKPYQDKMDKTIANLNSELDTVRAGRANPHVLDRITVDYYGSQMPIKNVANITVPEARIIQIQPWEGSMVKPIIKAIQASDLGINPGTDGKAIRLIFPELTEERRKQLSKDVKKQGEGAKVAIRNIRRDGNEAFKKLEKSEDVSEDVVSELQDDLQKITDKYGKKIDEIVNAKIKELMTV
ncbi:MAG: ribosome recycling factor [Eubacteriales bacterium]|jgi:ribosome recycling factor